MRNLTSRTRCLTPSAVGSCTQAHEELRSAFVFFPFEMLEMLFPSVRRERRTAELDAVGGYVLSQLGSNFYGFVLNRIFVESNDLSRDKKVWETRERAVNRAFVLQVSTIVSCLLSANVRARTHIFKLKFSMVNTDEMHGELSAAVSCYWCCDIISFFDTIAGSLDCLLRFYSCLLQPFLSSRSLFFPHFLYFMLVRRG